MDQVVDNFLRRGTAFPDLHNNGIKIGQGRAYPASDARKRTSVIFMKGRAHVGTLWTSGRRSLQAPSPSARLPNRLDAPLGSGTSVIFLRRCGTGRGSAQQTCFRLLRRVSRYGDPVPDDRWAQPRRSRADRIVAHPGIHRQMLDRSAAPRSAWEPIPDKRKAPAGQGPGALCRGDGRIRTAVGGFAGLCLTTRPRHQISHQ